MQQIMFQLMWNGMKRKNSTLSESFNQAVQNIISPMHVIYLHFILYIGQEGVGVADLSPWLDLRVPPKEVKFAGMCIMCDPAM